MFWLLWGCGAAEGTKDADGDGFDEGSDCDDADSMVNPSALELDNDGLDSNCDGEDDHGPYTLETLGMILYGDTGAVTLGQLAAYLPAYCDVDGDGLADLLMIPRDAEPLLYIKGPLSRGIWDSDDLRQAPPGFSISSGPLSAVACGDVDGDGNTDVVVQSRTSIAVLYSDEDGLTAEPAGTILGSVEYLQVDDFDGDGAAEIVGLNGAGDTLWHLPSRRYVHPEHLEDAGTAIALHDRMESLRPAGDLDGDGDPEVWAFRPRTPPVTLGFDPSVGRTPVRMSESANKVLFGDFDGDGQRDDLIGFRGGALVVSLNVDSPPIVNTQLNLRGALSLDSNQIMRFGDLDDDGADDFVLSYTTDNDRVVRIVSGAAVANARRDTAVASLGLFELREPREDSGVLRPFVEDLDGDGKPDLGVVKGTLPGTATLYGWLSTRE